MTLDEFDRTGFFWGIQALVKGSWIRVASVDFETRVIEDAEGEDIYPHEIERFSHPSSGRSD